MYRRSFLQLLGSTLGALSLELDTTPRALAETSGGLDWVYPENYGPIDGTNDARTIQAALNALKPGKTLVFRGGATYKPASKLRVPVGVKLFGNNCTFDLTKLNNTCFEIGDGTKITTSGPRSVIEDFNVVGSDDNTASLFVRAHSIERRLIIRDITTLHVPNVLDIRGPCFDFLADNINSAYSVGTWINLDLDANAFPVGANQATIRDCELSNNSTTPAGVGVKIGAYMNHVAVRHCWIEAVNRCVIVKGRYTKIDGCMFITGGASPLGVDIINDGRNTASGWDSKITGCTFTCVTGNAVGIRIAAGLKNTLVDGNTFYNSGAKSILGTYTGTNTVN